MKRFVTILSTLALLALALWLPACNTTKGFGTDLGNAGDGIKNSASRHGAD